jgi:hypothetical protein
VAHWTGDLNIEHIATICLSLGVIHTFCVSSILKLSHRFPADSFGANLFHILGEVEVVFGVWAAIFFILMCFTESFGSAVGYMESRNYSEPLFVFVIMAVSATKPILWMARALIETVSKVIPLPRSIAFYLSCLIVGPLLGSFITEPAAMTVTALILLDRLFKRDVSTALKYATLALLFVNVSIGGLLTPYAAPPVLMVATTWKWDIAFMLQHFGWKSVVALFLTTGLTAFRFRHEIMRLTPVGSTGLQPPPPAALTALHLLFLIAIVLMAHHPVIFFGLFLFFLGVFQASERHQGRLQLKESFLVAFFLGGLVVLGGMQSWWLTPLLSRLDSDLLYLGTIGLTAVTDNAALTFLGAQVPTLAEASRYTLVAGAVVGGGLTVIANAPNPAGFGILSDSFGEDGIHPLKLFTNALIPTVIAGLCFRFL